MSQVWFDSDAVNGDITQSAGYFTDSGLTQPYGSVVQDGDDLTLAGTTQPTNTPWSNIVSSLNSLSTTVAWDLSEAGVSGGWGGVTVGPGIVNFPGGADWWDGVTGDGAILGDGTSSGGVAGDSCTIGNQYQSDEFIHSGTIGSSCTVSDAFGIHINNSGSFGDYFDASNSTGVSNGGSIGNYAQIGGSTEAYSGFFGGTGAIGYFPTFTCASPDQSSQPAQGNLTNLQGVVWGPLVMLWGSGDLSGATITVSTGFMLGESVTIDNAPVEFIVPTFPAGSLTLASAGTFGIGGGSETASLVLPAQNQVETATVYGVGGDESTGTLASGGGNVFISVPALGLF